MTIYFNSHDIQIYRHRRKGSSNRFGMSATLTVVSADIQPMTQERTNLFDGKYGQMWDTFMDSSIQIKEGDQCVDTATNKRYSVRSVTQWSGAGLLDHKEVVLVSMDGTDA